MAVSFMRSLRRLCNTDHFPADFTIHCGDREWPAHRLVLAATSGFFEKVCYGGFKEEHEGCVYLTEDDPDDVARMVNYFYTFNYDGNEETCDLYDEKSTHSILTHARMYVLADKYECHGLKAYALTSVETVTSAMTWVPGEGCIISEEAIGAIMEAVSFIYNNVSSESDKLRRCLAGAIRGRLRKGNGLSWSREKWVKMMQDVPEFVADVLGYQPVSCSN